ncbi:MAG: type IX secretion system outer membrane channel protein PorV [Bacteroidales bacterium]|jgi:hypothetical protein|nr:type IX secretion system outer membrane channel protein PorV [Bacteroidales bacterium]
MNLFRTTVFSVVLIPVSLSAQHSTGVINNTDVPNAIRTAVPFMTIAPDSRSSAMADVGVATTPDVNSQHWNPAKYVFMEKKGGIALSYSPWLRSLVDDMNLLYLTGYWNLGRIQAVSFSLRYFDMGSISFTDSNGSTLRTGNPNEFAFDVGYSRKISENISAGIAFRYIRSDLSSGVSQASSPKAKAGNSFAGDISMYYHSDMYIGEKKGQWAVGINLSNLGSKMSYSNEQEKMFIPMNLCIGGSVGFFFDSYNKLTMAADFNKLLVPTPNDNNNDDMSVPKGLFRSFSDAPGGFEEELHEITVGGGLEYSYRNFFAVRTGYHHENRYKGNRRYFTMGVGVVMNVFEIDFSYLITPYNNRDPLANTLRFSLVFNIGEASGN